MPGDGEDGHKPEAPAKEGTYFLAIPSFHSLALQAYVRGAKSRSVRTHCRCRFQRKLP